VFEQTAAQNRDTLFQHRFGQGDHHRTDVLQRHADLVLPAGLHHLLGLGQHQELQIAVGKTARKTFGANRRRPHQSAAFVEYLHVIDHFFLGQHRRDARQRLAARLHHPVQRPLARGQLPRHLCRLQLP